MFTTEWLPGDYLAFAGMFIVIGLLIYGHLRAVYLQRRAQRELDRRLGHPARIHRATEDARIREQTWGRR